MKKSLQLTCGMLFASATLWAAAPEGNLYVLGLNGQTAPSDDNCLVLGERSEDDIEEGLWRWILPEFELTTTEGTLTITDGKSLTLGFDENNEFGFTNDLTKKQAMLYMAPNGPAVNYNLPAGSYEISIALFEDIYGDMGGDSWMISVKALGGEESEDNYYLLGFNDYETPVAACRFTKEETTEDGETTIIYKLPRYYVSECENGFTVYDSGEDITYGKTEAFAAMGDLSDENPMAFLGPDGEPMKCGLKEGYYDINLNATGAMAMVAFLRCEDQTAQDELNYYLVGVNGVDKIDEAYKFTRTVESGEEEDEDTGELTSYTIVTYTLDNVEITEDAELTVVAQDNMYAFGYNDDMAAFLPNDFNDIMPFASMVAGGEPVKCTLTPGKYNFNFSISGVNTGLMGATSAEEDAVEGISAASGSAVYYNLQGVRVANPEKGIYIKVADGKTSKVIR